MAKAKVLTKDEARRVLRIAETGNHGQRDKLALALSILGGMRVGEIAALKIGDVRGIDGKAVEVVHLTRHQTKGNRSRRVFLSDELRKIINGFLSCSMNAPDTAPLIASSRTRQHMSNVTLSMRIKSIYRAAGIDTSSHAGRRTFATRKNELGIVDLYRFCAGHLSHYATLASNASGLMPPRYEWRLRVL